MARRKTKTRSKSKEIVVRPRVTVASPAVRSVRAVARRARPYARRGLTKAKKLALAEKHTLVATGSAAVLAYAEHSGWLEKLPTVGNIDKKAIVGLGAFVVAKYSKNPTMAHVATGLLSVAAYDAVKAHMESTSGYPLAGYPLGYDADEDDEF